MISVLISTKNRPDKLKMCLKTILKNSFKNFEVVLIDQSNNEDTQTIVNHLKSKKIRYFKTNQTGKAKALNFAIQKSKYELLAFTDDDCISTKNWLQEIHDFYHTHKYIAGVFGNTYPYQINTRARETCPSTFEADKIMSFSYPNIIHYHCLGQGNNMSLRKSMITSTGAFKEWLGVGSVAQAGEESELIFRILKHHNTLMTNPNMIIYHNRWLSYTDERLLQSSYTRGLLAFYAYYFFTPDRKITWSMVGMRINERMLPAVKKIKTSILNNPLGVKHIIREIYLTLNEAVNGLYGILLGVLFRMYQTLFLTKKRVLL
jgi:glycosyltransferase involved in cell wall biosynthesis